MVDVEQQVRVGAPLGNYHTQALTRGLLVLECLGRDRGPVTLAELHDETGLPKSTLVRLLSELTEMQYAVRVDERPAYRLGHKVMRLGNSYLASVDISQVAGTYLTELSSRTRQTSNLGVLDGRQVLHVAIEVPDRPLRFEAAVGVKADTYCTGLGKLLLSALPDDQLEDHLPVGELVKKASLTITDLTSLRADLEATRARGYAFDDNEHSDGLRCLAVPLVSGGRTIAALSVSGPAAEFDAEQRAEFVDALRTVAAQLVADPEVVDSLLKLDVESTRDETEPSA